MKRILKIFILTIALTVSMLYATAKPNGKFARYSQVTDKEVMLVSNKGVKVLFTAYDNQNIGFSWHNKHDSVELILPVNIFDEHDLRGSIYVEELDELMQITTTCSNGLMIKVDKKNFTFTFINKANNTEISVGDDLISGLVSIAAPMMVVEKLEEETKFEVRPRL
jgi:hypothetical protein